MQPRMSKYKWYSTLCLGFWKYLKQVMVKTMEFHIAFNKYEYFKILYNWDG